MALPSRIALPIDDALADITRAMRARGALVLVAEPGAGKTTRVPPALLDAGLAENGEVLVLEPRRLATRMAAKRVAEERGEALGETVGYEVRFDRVASAHTRIRFVTEGILTRRLASDPTLRGVGAVVLDEFHERNLHGDVGLALLQRLRAGARPELRLCVMSATLDAEPLADFLNADIVRVPGRVFPVAVEHAAAESERHLDQRVAAAVGRLVARGLDGDVLVFLPGAGEIRRARDALEALARDADLLVFPLHGDLPAAEQDRAVAPANKRKVILSTNIAETSLTIDGVVAVIDSGLARVMRHSPWSGLPSLELAKVSRASATQRAGRAGRTRPGECWRLYTKHDHDTRPAHDVPEILRADLAEVVLALRATGVRDPEALGWYEPPGSLAVAAADRLLARLGAVDGGGSVTEVGRRLLSLPLHPRIGRLFVEAEARGLGARGALLAAVVSERDPRLSARTSLGGGGGDARDGARSSGPSDLLARLEAFEAVDRGGGGGQGALRDRCRQHGLDSAAYFSIARAREALARRLRPAPKAARCLDEDSAMLMSVLAAFPDRVGKRRVARGADVVLAEGGAVKLSPSSVVHDAQWMVVVEAEEARGAVMARAASAIEPDWLLDLYSERVREVRTVRFDESAERVDVWSALLYDNLALEESRAEAVGEDVESCLFNAAWARGVGAITDLAAHERLVQRLRFVAQHEPAFPAADEQHVRSAVRALCVGRRSLRELRDASLPEALLQMLDGPQRALLARLAPETFTLPGGRRLQIQYEAQKPPWAESRMQDFFGMADGPRVANGCVPLVLHLNAPNGRAVQVTTDLAGFWSRHYPAIRKELMRKYPRHSWPEDPRTAEPPRPGRPR